MRKEQTFQLQIVHSKGAVQGLWGFLPKDLKYPILRTQTSDHKPKIAKQPLVRVMLGFLFPNSVQNSWRVLVVVFGTQFDTLGGSRRAVGSDRPPLRSLRRRVGNGPGPQKRRVKLLFRSQICIWLRSGTVPKLMVSQNVQKRFGFGCFLWKAIKTKFPWLTPHAADP